MAFVWRIGRVLLFASSLLAVSASAAAQSTSDPVLPGTLHSYATVYSIGLEWDVSNDSNHDATATTEYRVRGTTIWKQGPALLRIDYNGSNMLAGSLLFLAPQTEYDVRVTLGDPDGGGTTREITIATRPLPVVAGGGRVFHVAPGTGAGDGSLVAPFGGVAAAEAVAQPGDTFLLHAGNYGGRIRFQKAGTATAHIVWKAAGDGPVTMNGVDVAASHVWLEGLAIANQTHGLLTSGAPSNVVITRCHFENNHHAIFLNMGGVAWYIADNTIVGDTPATSGSLSGEGINLNTTHGHTIAHNSITNVADGISEPGYNVDIFGNDIFDTSDDGIEGDHGAANVRMWGNRIHNAVHNGISFQPQGSAPWYIVRNQIVGSVESALKFRTTDRFVLVHNTIVHWGDAWPGTSMMCCNEWDLLRAYARNNLWISVQGGQIWGFEAETRDWRADLDFDGFDWGDAADPFTYGGFVYPDVWSFAGASGLESNGIRVSRTACFADFQVPGPSPASVPPHVMHLQPGCNAIDAGAIVAGLTDGFAGGAPDLGAHEYGHASATYGPRVAGEIVISPEAIAYPATVAGGTNGPARITVTSGGSAAVWVGAVKIAGAHAGEFRVTRDTCSGATLPPGATCEIDVAFAPRAQGSFSAAVAISSNAAGNPHAVPLSGTGTAPATGTLPPPWTSRDIGAVGTAGRASYANGTFTVEGGGTDIWSTADAFHFVHQRWTGDGDLTARIDQLTKPADAAFAMAGLMFRESAAAGSRHATMIITSDAKAKFRRRVVTNGTTLSDGPGAGTTPVPRWLKVSRRGDAFTAYLSADGSVWTRVHVAETIGMPQTLDVGFFALRNGGSGLASARFTGATLTAGTSSSLPAGWISGDVGSVGSPGSATHTNGTFTVRAAGADIWASADAFHFVHRPWTGDGDLVARVAQLTRPAGAAFALAGIMFRDTMAAGSRHASLIVSTDGKAKFRRRLTAGGTTLSDGPSAGTTPLPRWLKVSRRGNVFTAYLSVDGVSWTQVHVGETIALASTVEVGLVALRNGGSALTDATFTNVSLSTATTLPTGWTNVDVGSVGTRGSASYAAGTFTIRAGGTDLWSTADAFHLAYRPWTGDAEVVARVTTLTKPAGSVFALGAVTIRESLDANARHASMMVASDAKAKFRRRLAPGATTLSDGPSAGTTPVPRWIRVVRRGNTFTAFLSTDGITWQTVASESIAMSSAVYVGILGLRNGGVDQGSAVFDNVIVR